MPLPGMNSSIGLSGKRKRKFTITPAVGGLTEIDLDALGQFLVSTNGAWDIVPEFTFQVHATLWGTAGPGGSVTSAGRAGSSGNTSFDTMLITGGEAGGNANSGTLDGAGGSAGSAATGGDTNTNGPAGQNGSHGGSSVHGGDGLGAPEGGGNVGGPSRSTPGQNNGSNGSSPGGAGSGACAYDNTPTYRAAGGGQPGGECKKLITFIAGQVYHLVIGNASSPTSGTSGTGGSGRPGQLKLT